MPSRIRSRLGKTDEDRQYQKHLADSERSLRLAWEIASHVTRTARQTQMGRRAQDHVKVIQAALRAIGNLGYLNPGLDEDDPDFGFVVPAAAPGRPVSELKDR